MEQESFEDRMSRIARDGHQAEVLLSHPLIQRFLEDKRDTAAKAIRQMPLPAKHEDYIAQHAILRALDLFEEQLRGYVEEWGYLKELDEQGEFTNQGDTSL